MKTLPHYMVCIIVSLSLFSTNSLAQEKERKEKFKTGFSKHQIDLNFGVGLNMVTMVNNAPVSIPPVGVTADYAIGKKISVGLSFGYAAVGTYLPEFKRRRAGAFDDPIITEGSSEQILVFGTRFAAHYNQLEKLDIYGGPTIGMRYSLVSGPDENASLNEIMQGEETEKKVAFGGFVGIRYRVVKNFGIFAELGALHGAFQVGLNLRL